jgi:hypothetical protein
MAWTTPVTQATGVLITAAIWNAQVPDNMSFLHDVPACRVYNAASPLLVSGSNTVLPFSTARFDSDAIYNNGASVSRLTCHHDGVYEIFGSVSFAANAVGERGIWIRLNGATEFAEICVPANATGGAPTSLSISTCYALSVNDYVELFAWQTSGGNLDVLASGNFSPEFGMVRLSS